MASKPSTVKKRRLTSRASVQPAVSPQAMSVPEPESPKEEPPIAIGSDDQEEMVVKEEEEGRGEEEEEREDIFEEEIDLKLFFRSRMVLTGLADSIWTEEHNQILDEFIMEPGEPILTVFIDPCAGLKLELGMPIQTQNQLNYFIRQLPVPITPENFEVTVQFGTVRGSHIPALLRLLNGIYAPQIFGNVTWPESIRNQFSSHLHKFLACLTGKGHGRGGDASSTKWE
ncbi:dynein axonemal heavy chain 2-like isoform X2 [Sminthopsis crassicaudata]|uniref:dynein axonemal heavy chain 2-like isoform X2 n=1 Tax=Sminthopsis crassicaudata TaxID=9301 RepID=UPI003D683A64